MNVKAIPSRRAAAFLAAALSLTIPGTSLLAEMPWDHGPLEIGHDGRTLVHQDGAEFFWLGDTAWMMLHRASRKEVEQYFADRSAKQFNVTLQVVLGEIGEWNQPNRNGDRPFQKGDPTLPNEPYWRFVDAMFDLAEQRGMYVALLPTWGRWVVDHPHITEENAPGYGEFLGRRYGTRPNVIWVLGGDRPPVKDDQDYRPLWSKMAAAIVKGAGRDPLITYHRKFEWKLNCEPWYDLYMTGPAHGRVDSRFIIEAVEYDWRLEPTKPIVDGEPPYEDHPIGWDGAANGYFKPFDIRQAAYWNLLTGAVGFSYGHHSIWQWYWPPTYQRYGEVIVTAEEALDRPAAGQMRHLRALAESRPLQGRRPNQALLAANFDKMDDKVAGRHMRAVMGTSYAMVYTPYGDPIRLCPAELPWKSVRASWFDPRTGKLTGLGELARPEDTDLSFDPPGQPARGNDWVLILDHASTP